MILELFDWNDSILSLHLAAMGSQLCIDVEDSCFYANEEQALQIAEHLQRWAKRNEVTQ